MKLDCLFADVTAVTMAAPGVLRSAYVGVADGKIVYIGREMPRDTEIARVIRKPHRVLMPGMTNAHTHIAMTAFRGYADDLPLHRWLFEKIFPAEAKLDARGVYLAARLGMLEALSTGTTAVCDAYFNLDSIAKAAKECGIRANICNMLTYFGEGAAPDTDNAFRETRELAAAYAGDALVTTDMGLHSVYTSTQSSWEKVGVYAREHNLRLHIHLSETQKENDDCFAKYGCSPTAALERAGVFDNAVTAAHCVFLSEADRTILRMHNTVIAHNPTSNCKLASGIADVASMKGIPVALGTDGMASNNTHDLFGEMKLCAMLAKVRAMDASICPADEVVRMATVGGAAAVGREGCCGKLKVGYDADIVMLNFDTPSLSPCYDTLSHLVYAATGRDVELTMVGGRVAYENGAFPGIDAEKCAAELREYCKATFGERV
ncbi:MAG: amidohydrolase [Clostridiaceae bacterium]|nr:amidohydrolase [Clostridiaceae bacterium]